MKKIVNKKVEADSTEIASQTNSTTVEKGKTDFEQKQPKRVQVQQKKAGSDQKQTTPKKAMAKTSSDKTLEFRTWAEAFKSDGETPEFMVPKSCDIIFPWTEVDEDGFALKGSLYRR
ncbi:MAG: hypothetical protein LBU84_13655 [Prevotella sp.]|jgi:hypothetical protein|nr:hypothetical protein [Prevotella sp.]